ncbi:hypothetical protein M3Y97_00059200 [Aphelenchoides bicaudatus]|nr:hypothetical protein M3Y97_00059200 [Aphelenchoides bicaudatus]
MPLLTTKLLQNLDEISNEKRLPLKIVLQAILLFSCIIIIIYFYYGCSTNVQLQTWHQFTELINTTEDLVISENSKLKPLSGTTFCFVNIKPDDDQDQINAVQKTWMRSCNNSQFFTYKSLAKTHILPYRTIFSPLETVQETDFWELVYGFAYSFTQISSRFEWYINAQIDSFVFLQHLTDRLQRLNYQRPSVIVAQTKQDFGGLTIINHYAMELLINNLYGNDTLCPFSERPIEGLKTCFLNAGVETIDERQLKLHLLEYDNVRWVDHLEQELATSNNLLAITGLDSHLLYLTKLLTEERHLHNVQSNYTECPCNQ